MLLMGNNWAESATEAAQKPISLSSNLRVSLTMQHTDARLPLTQDYCLSVWLSGYIRESISLV
jgi:hypothetical protein